MNCETATVIDQRVTTQTRLLGATSGSTANIQGVGALGGIVGAVATGSCKGTAHGCCPDGETIAKGPNALGCPVLAWEPKEK